MPEIEFTKMTASGNDYVVVDNRAQVVPGELGRFAHSLCTRKFGVGADGLLLLENTEGPTSFRMRIFNPDGSEPEMCGNGARCLARFAHTRGVTGRTMAFETQAGVIRAEIIGESVKLAMIEPQGLRLNHPLEVQGAELHLHTINTGVPHAVILVDDWNKADVNGLGRIIRNHPFFSPAGTNVNFVEPVDSSTIRIRTYERGVEEETLACGTGSVASAIISFLLGNVSALPVKVETRGGVTLRVHFAIEDNQARGVYLEGDACTVYEGRLNYEPPAAGELER